MNRDAQLGQLSRLKQERYRLRVEIDDHVKAILHHFDPLDQDLYYTHKILPDRLTMQVDAIERKKKRLDKVQQEIERLGKELNEDTD